MGGDIVDVHVMIQERGHFEHIHSMSYCSLPISINFSSHIMTSKRQSLKTVFWSLMHLTEGENSLQLASDVVFKDRITEMGLFHTKHQITDVSTMLSMS